MYKIAEIFYKNEGIEKSYFSDSVNKKAQDGLSHHPVNENNIRYFSIHTEVSDMS